jgi:pumilio homology domain family member 6
MSLKRKSAGSGPIQSKTKAIKLDHSNKRSSKLSNDERLKKVREEEPSESNGEEEFQGFGNDDDLDDDSASGEDESMDNEEEEISGEDEEEDGESGDEDDSEEMQVDNQPNGHPKQKDVPAHAAQRALAKERKLQKPHAPKVHRAKQIWESLRQRNQSKEERQKLVDELFDVIKGDIPALVFGHSASRFVQAAMKYGNIEQRMAIAKELEGRYVELAKGKYGKFLVTKILEYGYPTCGWTNGRNQDVRTLLIKEFMGNVGRLISHKEAGMVVNDIYRDICTRTQKLEFLHEIYGPEFRLFKVISYRRN